MTLSFPACRCCSSCYCRAFVVAVVVALSFQVYVKGGVGFALWGLCWGRWGILELCCHCGYVGPSWVYNWGYVGQSWSFVGTASAILGPCWDYVGPSWRYVGPCSGLCWTLRYALEVILGRVILGHLQTKILIENALPQWPANLMSEMLLSALSPVACKFHLPPIEHLRSLSAGRGEGFGRC